MKPDISVEVYGKVFKNPIIVASATPTKNFDYMKRCVDAGAGGIISKTVTFEPALHKYVSPRFTVLHKKGWPHAFSNYSAEFLATYTPDVWMKELEETQKYCAAHNCVFIASISGDTLEHWVELAKMVESIGADMIECNFGCPHPRDLGYKSGQELGADPVAAAEVTKLVTDAVKIPVIIKLTAEAVDLLDVAKRVAAAGADGVTVHNRFPALDIDIETGRPLLHGSFAGVGGPWMRPIMLKWVAKVARTIDLPISATNGIWTWDDVVKSIMCGASTVQTCTAIMYSNKQFGIIGDYIKGLENFMEAKGYKTIAEMRGITLGQLKTWDKVDRETVFKSHVDPAKCTGCKLCLNWCFYDAITIVDKKAVIDVNKCDGCGLCPSLCPADAIKMDGLGQSYLGNFR